MKATTTQHYQRLTEIAKNEAISLSKDVLATFDNSESIHHYLRALFYHHAILNQEQFALYFGIMYEVIGSEMPLDLDYYLVMDQHSTTFTSCFLSALLVTVLSEVGGEG